VAEVVTLLAITVYFMQQNRKMMDLIDSLTDKVEDQEEKIEKHDKVIADILKTMNKANQSSSSRPNTNSNLPIFTTTATVSTLPSTTFIFDPKPSINLCFDNDCGDEEEEEEQDHEHEHDHDHEEEEAEQKYEVSKVEELDELIGLEFNDIHVDEVEEIIEIPIEDVKDTHTKKKRKKKKKTPSIAEIDKELEDELNDLYKEEIMNSH